LKRPVGSWGAYGILVYTYFYQRAFTMDISQVTDFCPCDLKSYEALFTTTRVNHLYHQMTLGS
ncbi:hypothetical protein EAY04_19785, partial [Vibrio anguillarum]|nr:hypothetical protein [Vibrio anguillarum]